ncbi:hypothetical protein FRC14_007096 [Serendipita sp. 396]|nr:hypothetical protein FRC14_007096 [Serendipita sp. 396]KAG8778798.1 hypothetical protein FRC15_010550 [Serendipita sp. 397]KAG8795850.1 hypothetical protein FRC16_009935 [Serendipita sp. 398]KAG8863056.1 hypothetical protein FRC20_010883 [Serendipita sp. 405]
MSERMYSSSSSIIKTRQEEGGERYGGVPRDRRDRRDAHRIGAKEKNEKEKNDIGFHACNVLEKGREPNDERLTAIRIGWDEFDDNENDEEEDGEALFLV